MDGRERILATIDGGKPDRLPFMPITMMFAADHAGKRYGDYAKDYRTLVECQLRVADDYEIDHVSCISDPAREAADCGGTIEYFDDQPPAIDESNAVLLEKSAFLSLKMPDPLGGGRMHDRVNAVALFKDRVGGHKLIEGWVEGPCAQAADLRGINTLMMDFYEDPDFVHDLFAFVVDMELRFARAQIDAGADIIGVGDAAASLIGPTLYEEFVLPHEMQLVRGIRDMGARVRLHICGDTSSICSGMGQLHCDIVDLDFPVSMRDARASMPSKQTLLGNIDPVRALRDGTPDSVYTAIAQCHHDAHAPYIVSAGCEVPRGTPPENLRAMLDFARSITPA